MTEQDYDLFLAEFRRLAAALERYKAMPADMSAKADAYFHVLKALSLREVVAKADAWLARETKMPKPAEWAGIVVQGAAPVPPLPEDEAREWLAAERRQWQDEPCGCFTCRRFNVADHPRRFVPMLDADDRDVRGRIGQRIVTRGSWIHGEELMRWYLARENFLALARPFIGAEVV